MSRNERNRDKSQKPAVIAWLNAHKGSSADVFNNVVKQLCGWYIGKLDGYVNIKKHVQYRFGGPKGIHDYVIVRGFVGSTRISFRSAEGNKWAALEVHHKSFESDFQAVQDFFVQHKVADFSMGSVKQVGDSLTDWHESSRLFDEEVFEIQRKGMSEEELLQKAGGFPEFPEKSLNSSQSFKRNPWVVAARLAHAKDRCEVSGCRNPMPFKRNDETTFLEVHHIQPLSRGGKDTFQNTIALCPNCHREQHYKLAQKN